MFSPKDILAHAEDFIGSALTEAGSELHSVVRNFAHFVEGKSAEQDAVDLLKSKGYHVEPPAPLV